MYKRTFGQWLLDVAAYGLLSFAVLFLSALSVMNYDACPPQGCGQLGQSVSFVVIPCVLFAGLVLLVIGRIKGLKKLVITAYILPVVVAAAHQILAEYRL